MTWTQFLAALAKGGWSTDIDPVLNPKPSAPDRLVCRSTSGDIVIETQWTSAAARKFVSATVNGLDAGQAELRVALQ